MKITIVAGTRPNFVKISSIIKAIDEFIEKKVPISYRLVHTGQHYDDTLSQSFFSDLELPHPDVNFGVGSGSQAEQTASIMIQFEKELQDHPTDVVIVVGDVNSTMACAIVAKKMNKVLVHVEGGIRSFDISMPEEINRRLTDSITDFYYTTSVYANENLEREGVDKSRINFVGNVMIDTLLRFQSALRKPNIFDSKSLIENEYLVLTLHRPSNVDDLSRLEQILNLIEEVGKETKVVFPVHPRTLNKLKSLEFICDNIIMCPPLPYLEFNYLVKHAKGVITDSGGITEETTVLNVPCITLRDTTERPETCIVGTNVLVGSDKDKFKKNLHLMLRGMWKDSSIPELWDGKSGERIINHLITITTKK
jgi:UDP-N-acetylglucosamine 2-epimerase (non-hydrolysing)